MEICLEVFFGFSIRWGLNCFGYLMHEVWKPGNEILLHLLVWKIDLALLVQLSWLKCLLHEWSNVDS